MKQFLKNHALDLIVIILLIIFISMLMKSITEDNISNDDVVETTSKPDSEIETTIAVPQVKEKVGFVVELTQPIKPQYYIEWLDMEISKEEFELLCRTTYCEAGNQDLETQTMVCLTILNRYANNNIKAFQGSIRDIVYGKNAYQVTTWSDFESRTWTEQVEMAVKNAMAYNNHPSDMYYFRTEHYHTFGQPYMVSGDLWFSTEH